jgi:DNA (cytosine-5)-methyltransferase 1
VVRGTEVHRYPIVITENVPGAADWPLFGCWLSAMTSLPPGYNYQLVSVSSAHVGGEDNEPASQWRDRLYVVFSRADVPMPDVEPRPPAWCALCEEAVSGIQTWKRDPGGIPRAGKYGQQYVYTCPRCTSSR